MRKPKLSYSEQVSHLVDKGIKFELMDKDTATNYLAKNNNFFKLMSYRKNYPKNIKTGKYIHMDFGHMVDLARIDTRLRVILIEMCLNIEHFSKVELIDKVTNADTEDGYSIVSDYFDSLDTIELSMLNKELTKSSISIYTKDLYDKYKQDLPIWAFLEMISFGTFIRFYSFCADRFDSKDMRNNRYLLMSIKKLRNAAAHNNCLINDLVSEDNSIRSNYKVSQAVANIGIKAKQRRKRMSSARVALIVTCLYMHKQCVPSAGTHQLVSEKLRTLGERFFREYTYEDNPVIQSTFNFFKKIIDNWY